MKIDFIGILQADFVVSGGFAFKAVINWWEIAILLIVVIAIVMYRRRKKRK
jgi:hypothetical protein